MTGELTAQEVEWCQVHSKQQQTVWTWPLLQNVATCAKGSDLARAIRSVAEPQSMPAPQNQRPRVLDLDHESDIDRINAFAGWHGKRTFYWRAGACWPSIDHAENTTRSRFDRCESPGGVWLHDLLH
jgi:hypothetical protein